MCNPCICVSVRNSAIVTLLWCFIYGTIELGIFGWQTQVVSDPYFFGERETLYQRKTENFLTSLYFTQFLHIAGDILLIISSGIGFVGIGSQKCYLLWPWFISMALNLSATLAWCCVWWYRGAYRYWAYLTALQICGFLINMCCFCIMLALHQVMWSGQSDNLVKTEPTRSWSVDNLPKTTTSRHQMSSDQIQSISRIVEQGDKRVEYDYGAGEKFNSVLGYNYANGSVLYNRSYLPEYHNKGMRPAETPLSNGFQHRTIYRNVENGYSDERGGHAGYNRNSNKGSPHKISEYRFNSTLENKNPELHFETNDNNVEYDRKSYFCPATGAVLQDQIPYHSNNFQRGLRALNDCRNNIENTTEGQHSNVPYPENNTSMQFQSYKMQTGDYTTGLRRSYMDQTYLGNDCNPSVNIGRPIVSDIPPAYAQICRKETPVKEIWPNEMDQYSHPKRSCGSQTVDSSSNDSGLDSNHFSRQSNQLQHNQHHRRRSYSVSHTHLGRNQKNHRYCRPRPRHHIANPHSRSASDSSTSCSYCSDCHSDSEVTSACSTCSPGSSCESCNKKKRTKEVKCDDKSYRNVPSVEYDNGQRGASVRFDTTVSFTNPCTGELQNPGNNSDAGERPARRQLREVIV